MIDSLTQRLQMRFLPVWYQYLSQIALPHAPPQFLVVQLLQPVLHCVPRLCVRPSLPHVAQYANLPPRAQMLLIVFDYFVVPRDHAPLHKMHRYLKRCIMQIQIKLYFVPTFIINIVFLHRFQPLHPILYNDDYQLRSNPCTLFVLYSSVYGYIFYKSMLLD